MTDSLARRVPLWALYLLTLALLVATANRWGSALAGWLQLIALVVLVRRVRGPAQVGGLVAVVTLGTFLQVLKVITEPISPILTVGFAAPAVAGTLLILALYRIVWNRGGEVAALAFLPSVFALSDWSTANATELGAWGTLAATQLDQLPLLQVTSLVGVPGFAFLMGAVAAAAGAALDGQRLTAPFVAPFAALLVVEVWGSVRLNAVPSGPTRTVAAVVTDLGLSPDGSWPSAAALAENTEVLFARTELAAQRGAQLVAWNEAAAFVEAEDEAPLLARGEETARRLGIDLVLAYAVLVSREPVLFGNRWVWFDPTGAKVQTYDKHHPVPGEPSVRGTDPIRVVERPWGKVGGAICYDYDFPALAAEHGRQGAVLAVVPSSDWLGIDPYHTWMARVRAIEQGFSLVRPVRWATSGAYDAYGRARGTMSPWEDNDRVMVATVPIRQVRTWYTRLGDAPTLTVSGVLLVVAAGLALVRRGQR